ncbi:hypothetical protein Dimus_024852 [Dionaea muscipula]
MLVCSPSPAGAPTKLHLQTHHSLAATISAHGRQGGGQNSISSICFLLLPDFKMKGILMQMNKKNLIV